MVFINDVLICSGSEHVAGSLFVCPWQPEKYLFGLHQIEIHIQVRFVMLYRVGLKAALSYYTFIFYKDIGNRVNLKQVLDIQKVTLVLKEPMKRNFFRRAYSYGENRFSIIL